MENVARGKAIERSREEIDRAYVQARSIVARRCRGRSSDSCADVVQRAVNRWAAESTTPGVKLGPWVTYAINERAEGDKEHARLVEGDPQTGVRLRPPSGDGDEDDDNRRFQRDDLDELIQNARAFARRELRRYDPQWTGGAETAVEGPLNAVNVRRAREAKKLLEELSDVLARVVEHVVSAPRDDDGNAYAVSARDARLYAARSAVEALRGQIHPTPAPAGTDVRQVIASTLGGDLLDVYAPSMTKLQAFVLRGLNDWRSMGYTRPLVQSEDGRIKIRQLTYACIYGDIWRPKIEKWSDDGMTVGEYVASVEKAIRPAVHELGETALRAGLMSAILGRK